MAETVPNEARETLRIELHPTPEQLEVRVAGPMDMASRRLLRAVVDGALTRVRDRRLLIDLRGVDLMDSAGLSELIETLLRCDEASVTWAVIPSPAVERLLLLVGVGRRRSDQSGSWLAGGGYGDD